MAQYGQDPNPPPQSGFYGSSDYGWSANPAESGYTFDMSGTEFGQEQQFGSFDYNSAQAAPGGAGPPPSAPAVQQPNLYDNNPYLQSHGTARYAGSIMTPGSSAFGAAPTSSFDDEPPLMEELGINFDHIVQKTLAALNPLKSTDAAIMQDTDLAGPLVFCLAFGGFLLLSGKVHFGYIYGIGLMGCLAMYCLLNLMSLNGVSVGVTISILGYCLLPMVGLSGISILLSLQGLFGLIIACTTVLWCSSSASKLFVTALTMDHQQLLVAYPCALVYGVFSLLTIF